MTGGGCVVPIDAFRIPTDRHRQNIEQVAWVQFLFFIYRGLIRMGTTSHVGKDYERERLRDQAIYQL